MNMGPGMDGGLMALLGIGIGVYSFLIFASLSPFIAGLLWAFGVHMAGQKEKNFLSYFGVACLCVLPASIFLGLAGLILSQVNNDPRALIFLFSLMFFVMQSFFSILFGKLIWKGTWTQSFVTWLILLILWFIVFLICWIVMFSY